MSFGPAGDAVLAAMRSFRFDMFESERTYFDFYFGGNLCLSLLVFLEALVIWLFSGLAMAPVSIQKNLKPDRKA